MKPPISPGWSWSTLERVAAPVPNAIVDGPFGSNLKLDDYIDDGEGVPVLQRKNVTGDRFTWSDVRFVSPEKAAQLKRSSVRVGDILMVKIGSIGYSAIVDNLNGFDHAIIPANLAKITVDQLEMNTGFLHHWLRSTEAERYLIESASKTAQPALSLSKFKKMPVPKPPLQEQRRIAAILDQAEGLRAKRRQALAKLDTLTQSLFLKMFGDPLRNPRDWPLVSIGSLSVGEPNNGIFRKNDEYGAGLPVVWVDKLFVGDVIDTAECRAIPPSAREIRQYGLKHGDILFCRSSLKLGGLGYNNVYVGENDAALFECHVIRISPDMRRINPIFLNFLLRVESQRSRLFRYAKTVTMSTIDQAGLMKIEVPVPPLAMQNEFAAHMNLRRMLISSFKSQSVQMENIGKSLQHRAFRGEL